MVESARRPQFGPRVGNRPHLASGFRGRWKMDTIRASSGVIWGMAANDNRAKSSSSKSTSCRPPT